MTLGSGFRYLMDSVAKGDGAPNPSNSLTRYYAESGTPPGVFLGAGLAGLGDGAGVEKGSEVTDEHLYRMLGLCADPLTGKPLGRIPNNPTRRDDTARQAGTSTGADSDTASTEGSDRLGFGRAIRVPVAGFDLTFSVSKSVSVAWAAADEATKAVIYGCHRQAVDYVLAYAEREVFHSRSGTNGVVDEDIDGVVAASFTHWDSRAGDPQLHDHVVVLNRARSSRDGVWRTLDSRGLFKATVALSELHHGVLSDLLTGALGWGWDGRARRHSSAPRWEVTGVPERLIAEFSQRAEMIEARTETLIGEFTAARGRRPVGSVLLRIRQQATLETRPDKTHRSLADMTERWGQRAATVLDVDDPVAWVATLADRNDLPLLHAGDLGDQILADAAAVAAETVAGRRATFSRANITAEVHRQLHGVRFASPDDRVAVAERTTDLALHTSLVVSAPDLHHTPERFRRLDGSSLFRTRDHAVYTTANLLEAEGRLLDVAGDVTGPAVPASTVAAVTGRDLPGASGRCQPIRLGPSNRSLPPVGFSMCWSGRPGPASRRRSPGCERCGRPSTVQGRSSASPRPPPPKSSPTSWGSTPRTWPNGPMSTLRPPGGSPRSTISEPFSPEAARTGATCRPASTCSGRRWTGGSHERGG
jgi:conjugative relaxase-like TrwC/TraI family protein